MPLIRGGHYLSGILVEHPIRPHGDVPKRRRQDVGQQPFTYKAGGGVIKGWDLGVRGRATKPHMVALLLRLFLVGILTEA